MVFLFVAGRSIGVIRKPGSLNAIPAGTMALIRHGNPARVISGSRSNHVTRIKERRKSTKYVFTK